MDQTTSSGDVKLPSWGKAIGHYHTFVYGLSLVYNTRQMVFHGMCIFYMPFLGCIGLEIALLIMVGASVIIADGIRTRKAGELVPWLFLTLLVVIACSVALFYIRNPQKIYVGLILASSILTWYPIFKLYHDMSSDDEDSECDPNGPNPPTATEQQGLTAAAGGYPRMYNAMQNIPGTNPLQGNAMFYATTPAAPGQYYLAGPGPYPPAYNGNAAPTGPYQGPYNALQAMHANMPLQANAPCATAVHAAVGAYPPTYNIIQDIPGANAGAPAGSHLDSPYPAATEQHTARGLGINSPSLNTIQEITGANASHDSQEGPDANPPAYNVIQDIPGANPTNNADSVATANEMVSKIEKDSKETEKQEPKNL